MNHQVNSQSHFKSDLFFMLAALTVLFILAQLSLFMIHAKVSLLIDESITNAVTSLLLQPIVLLPMMKFVLLQLFAYAVVVVWVWFIAVTVGEFFQLSKAFIYYGGILCWGLVCLTIWMLNSYYFPGSFFAKISHPFFSQANSVIFMAVLFAALSCLFSLTAIAYFHIFYAKCYRWLGSVFLLMFALTGAWPIVDYLSYRPRPIQAQAIAQPDIILIGLDSLRPDFTSYFGHAVSTPHIDQFLQTGTTFTQAYSPLGRTFPSWMSILTAKYPKHSAARNNLVDPKLVKFNETIAKRLQREGYETIYATDENRFSNITAEYGFQQILGPHMGVNDFLLGGLSDFPLTNLLVNMPFGRFLFPYQYGNRAAAITYDPNRFLHLLQLGLGKRSNKPLFLAIHLCLSHWPFTWAHDGIDGNASLLERYQNSVSAVDAEFSKLMQILKVNGLLENSMVVLLSDHGTTIGLPGDRLLRVNNYHGDLKQLKRIPVAKLSAAPPYSVDFKKDYTIETAYGQGTDVLSLKQHHVLLSFKSFGHVVFSSQPLSGKKINVVSSLIDVAPTLFDFLRLAPLAQGDGISLKPYFEHPHSQAASRPFFIETGDYVSELETDRIQVGEVIKKRIRLFQVDPTSGLVLMKQDAARSLIRNKQIAILWGDWILARYPALMQTKLVPAEKGGSRFFLKPYLAPSYFLIANVKTGEWAINFSTSFAKKAPIAKLMRELKEFYQEEY